MHRVRTSLLALLLLAASTSLAASTVSIADARSQPLGTVVTIEGSVTVPSGDFAASTFDQGFAVQDDTAGIYVSVAQNPNLNFHKRVRVTGVLADDGFNQLVLSPASLADVVKLPGASQIDAQAVATGGVSEATEGLLVEVEGIITRGPTNDLPFGYSVFVDDGSGETQIFIPATTGVNPFKIPWIQPGATIRARGLGAQFQAQYEILPRFRGDIHKGN